MFLIFNLYERNTNMDSVENRQVHRNLLELVEALKNIIYLALTFNWHLLFTFVLNYTNTQDGYLRI